jgi:hypothetical protein
MWRVWLAEVTRFLADLGEQWLSGNPDIVTAGELDQQGMVDARTIM